MAKCIKCGKSTIVRGHVKLADAAICTPCFKSLGFKLTDTSTASIYKYEDISNGLDAYYQNRHKAKVNEAVRSSVSVTMTGGERDLVCTEEEREIYNRIALILEESDLDVSPIRFTRKSDNYVTVVMDSSADYGAMDLARIKFTPRAKWIWFVTEPDKVQIESVDAIDKLSDKIIASYNFNAKYL